jgi:hypothetical protein
MHKNLKKIAILLSMATITVVSFQNCSGAFTETPLVADDATELNSTTTTNLILAEPLTSYGYVGQPLTLVAMATGLSGITYQWQKNGVAISNATSNTFILASAASTDSGSYSVLITDSQGDQQESAVATVQIFADPSGTIAPSLIEPPTSQAVPTASSVAFAMSYTGYPTPSVQWYKNGVAIAGQTTAVLRLNNVSASDVASYSAILTNSAGNTPTGSVQLTLSQ